MNPASIAGLALIGIAVVGASVQVITQRFGARDDDGTLLVGLPILLTLAGLIMTVVGVMT